MLGIGLNANVAMIESAQTLPLVILLMGVALTLSILISLAMIESTAIYCFVVTMILLFVNPFWEHFKGG